MQHIDRVLYLYDHLHLPFQARILVFLIGVLVGYLLPTGLKITLIYVGDVIVWAFVITLVAIVHGLCHDGTDPVKIKNSWKTFVEFFSRYHSSTYFTDGILSEILFEMAGGSQGLFYYFFPATFVAICFSSIVSEIMEKKGEKSTTNTTEERKQFMSDFKKAADDFSATIRRHRTGGEVVNQEIPPQEVPSEPPQEVHSEQTPQEENSNMAPPEEPPVSTPDANNAPTSTVDDTIASQLMK